MSCLVPDISIRALRRRHGEVLPDVVVHIRRAAGPPVARTLQRAAPGQHPAVPHPQDLRVPLERERGCRADPRAANHFVAELRRVPVVDLVADDDPGQLGCVLCQRPCSGRGEAGSSI